MTPVSRRIFTYWLLLLVPTLVVGAAAIQLLRREQARLAEQGAFAEEARRAAVGARARLIAENVELLVGEVEAGLIDTLAAEPAAGLDGFLAEWEKKQPLVRRAFRSRADGRLLRPTVADTDEDARAFVRRFAKLTTEGLPWGPPPATVSKLSALAPAQEKKIQADEEARKDVAANVAQTQSARRDVQELFKSQREYSQAANVAQSAVQGAVQAAPQIAAPAAASSQEYGRRGSASNERQRAESDLAKLGDQTRRVAFEAVAAAAPAAAAARGEPAVQIASGSSDANFRQAASDRSGWRPALIDGRFHLIGWLLPGETEIRGVEVELAALIARLGGVLPAEVEAGVGYALRDDQGRVLHQVGAIPRASQPASRVPLASTLLPGWDIVGYLTLAPVTKMNGGAFFGVSVLLVGIFIAAILAGGSLLLWQARRSEEEAVQKTSFVANVSHEFKTPLTTIRLYSELLEQGRVRDPAQGAEYLRTIGRETQRLARLVNNALDFSRLEQGRKKYERQRLDVAAEVARLLDTQEPRLAELGLRLVRSLPATPVPAMTDRDALEQIVLNLIDNACKYATSGGEVLVGVSTWKGGGVQARVADCGPGVPPEHRERIFEKFHRVDDRLTAEKAGAGLGLSIARQLARGLGGELRYVPRDGGGAEFVLELP